ncbi:unnamed protein product [Knipowitschia caucasica]
MNDVVARNKERKTRRGPFAVEQTCSGKHNYLHFSPTNKVGGCIVELSHAFEPDSGQSLFGYILAYQFLPGHVAEGAVDGDAQTFSTQPSSIQISKE